jgi:signal transduction histidine kinase
VTLRLRILLLFTAFSVLPVLLLGAGDYVQSVRALQVVVDARAARDAAEIAKEVEDSYAAARAALRSAAVRVGRDGADGTDLAALLSRSLPQFSGLRLVGDGEELGTARQVARQTRSCSVEGRQVAVQVDVPGQADLRLVGYMPLTSVLAPVERLEHAVGESGFTQAIDPADGTILFDSRCTDLGSVAGAPLVRAVAGLDPSHPFRSSSHRYEGEGGDWHAGLALAPSAGVAVVAHTSDAEFIAPFRRSRLEYLTITLLVLVGAALGFVVMAQGAFRSLRALTAAAEQIEAGNTKPWLPPPGQDEIGRLALAFRRMVDRLSESIRRAELSQKLASVGELASYLSHEIRNPLSSIRLSLQSLHRDLSAGFIPEDTDRIIQIALGEVNRLDGVVQTVLVMGRQNGNALDRTCSVHESLAATLDVIRPKAAALGVQLEFVPRATDDHVQAEPEALRGVWINLLVNALDALEGRDDGRIRISTWSAAEPDEELHVRFADNGPGVPPEVADSIFEPFFTTKVSGNGIGLPTALRSVQQWGGTITYEPVVAGSGAVFIVKLRRADGPSAGDPVDATGEPRLEPALPN